MLVAGLFVSAVAVLLGIFTKLPQGGGGIANNLMVISCFLSIQPLYLAEVERVSRQAREQRKIATEREREMEQRLKGLEKERDDAVKERARGREDLERFEREEKRKRKV